MTFNEQMMHITRLGYTVREQGRPREAPYLGQTGFNRKRREVWLEGWDCADKARILQLRQHPSGQWQYRVMHDKRVIVPWQFGPWPKDECVAQAVARFGQHEFTETIPYTEDKA